MSEQHEPAALELYLLRHAHAGNSADWKGPDASRPLSAKGRRQADRLGRFLAGRAFAVDTIVSSPKLRALETARLVGDALGVGVASDDRLARALDLEVLEAVLKGAGGQRVMLVGHDPDFSELAATLSGTMHLPLKKGALARIDVLIPLEPAAGSLRWLLPPDVLGDDAR